MCPGPLGIRSLPAPALDSLARPTSRPKECAGPVRYCASRQVLTRLFRAKLQSSHHPSVSPRIRFFSVCRRPEPRWWGRLSGPGNLSSEIRPTPRGDFSARLLIPSHLTTLVPRASSQAYLPAGRARHVCTRSSMPRQGRNDHVSRAWRAQRRTARLRRPTTLVRISRAPSTRSNWKEHV